MAPPHVESFPYSRHFFLRAKGFFAPSARETRFSEFTVGNGLLVSTMSVLRIFPFNIIYFPIDSFVDSLILLASVLGGHALFMSCIILMSLPHVVSCLYGLMQIGVGLSVGLACALLGVVASIFEGIGFINDKKAEIFSVENITDIANRVRSTGSKGDKKLLAIDPDFAYENPVFSTTTLDATVIAMPKSVTAAGNAGSAGSVTRPVVKAFRNVVEQVSAGAAKRSDDEATELERLLNDPALRVPSDDSGDEVERSFSAGRVRQHA